MNDTVTPAKPARLTMRRKRSLAARISRALERGRSCYDAADKLTAELVDNFATSNVAFKTASVKRIELKRLTKTEEHEYAQSKLPHPSVA